MTDRTSTFGESATGTSGYISSPTRPLWVSAKVARSGTEGRNLGCTLLVL